MSQGTKRYCFFYDVHNCNEDNEGMKIQPEFIRSEAVAARLSYTAMSAKMKQRISKGTTRKSRCLILRMNV